MLRLARNDHKPDPDMSKEMLLHLSSAFWLILRELRFHGNQLIDTELQVVLDDLKTVKLDSLLGDQT